MYCDRVLAERESKMVQVVVQWQTTTPFSQQNDVLFTICVDYGDKIGEAYKTVSKIGDQHSFWCWHKPITYSEVEAQQTQDAVSAAYSE